MKHQSFLWDLYLRDHFDAYVNPFLCFSFNSQLKMETGLHERDRAGVQDFVLLENYQSEEAFIGNLKKRFQEDLIYVSKNR